jgi:hypothetical protein
MVGEKEINSCPFPLFLISINLDLLTAQETGCIMPVLACANSTISLQRKLDAEQKTAVSAKSYRR